MSKGRFLLCAVLAVGCAAQTLLSPDDQRQVISSQQGRGYHLKYSFFVGPFFSYADRYYICERDFDERVLVQGPGGEAILSAEPLAILPVGTRVVVDKVEFPTSAAMASRKLKSPRHFTWVYLRPAERQLDKPLVLVLTQTMRRPADFERALAAYLVKEDPRSTLTNLPQQIYQAVETKQPVAGMPADALLRCRGHPDKILRRHQAGQRQEIWQYAPGRRVFLTNDVVVKAEGFPERELPLWKSPVPGKAATRQPDHAAPADQPGEGP